MKRAFEVDVLLCECGGQPYGLTLSGAAPQATSVLVLGSGPAFMPLFGGELVPAAALLIPLPTSAGGLAQVQGTWPVGVPTGTEFWLQSWVVDPAGPQGFAASNGLLCKAP